MDSKKLNLTAAGQEKVAYDGTGTAVCIDVHDFARAEYRQIDWHWHTEFQFYWVRRGAAEIWVEAERFALSAGAVLFIGAGQAHRCLARTADAEVISVDVHPRLVGPEGGELYRRYAQPLLGGKPECVLFAPDAPDGRTVRDGLAALYRAWEEPGAYRAIRVQARGLSLWESFLSALPEEVLHPARGAAEQSRLKQMLAFLQAHYAEPVTLEALAAEVHLSRSECSRYFKRAVGQPPFAYLNAYRIERSLRLLCESNASIAEVAAAVGFGSQSHFTAQFRRRQGMTPGQYRRRWQG